MPEELEPDPATQEMTAAHARSYACATPRPQGAAAADRPPRIPLAPRKRMQAQFNPLADGMIYLVVFLGGFIGTAMRYGLSLVMPATAAEEGFFGAFHLATFTANMTACFIFAALTAYLSQAAWIRKRCRELVSRGVGMGMCGGFSTLSAMVVEELTAIQDGQIGGFLFYMLFSFVCGLSAAWLGVRLAFALSAKRTAALVSEAVAGANGGKAAGNGNVDGIGATARGGSAGRAKHAAKGGAKRSTAGAGVTVNVSMAGVTAGGIGETDRVAGDAVDGVTAGGTDGTAVGGADANGRSGNVGPSAAPAFEPASVTDEIPMVGDPISGDAVPSKEARA